MADPMSMISNLLTVTEKMGKAQESTKQRKNILDTLDRMQSTHSKLMGGSSGPLSRIKGLMNVTSAKIGLEPAEDIQTYKTLSTLLFGPMARQVMQEKGVLSEGDINRIKEAIPTLYSTPKEATAAFNELRRKVEMMPESVFNFSGVEGGQK